MSLLDWFARRKRRDPQHSAPPSSGLSRLDSTRPAHAARHAATAQPANRKQERMARRELLYAVVRESMVRAGVLSSSYKFKVLSLDARGQQFLVMVDMAQGCGADMVRLAEIEALIAQAAKSRYQILVTAVYWRANEHVAVGDPAARGRAPAPLHGHRATPSRPAPLEAVAEPVSGPAELHRAQGPSPEEVAAFRRALSASLKGEKALAGAAQKRSPQPPLQSPPRYALLTGFEDTEMVSQNDDLSGTQYGDLR